MTSSAIHLIHYVVLSSFHWNSENGRLLYMKDFVAPFFTRTIYLANGGFLTPSILHCEECRAEASMKKENREKEGNTGLMGAWSHAQYAGERERV